MDLPLPNKILMALALCTAIFQPAAFAQSVSPLRPHASSIQRLSQLQRETVDNTFQQQIPSTNLDFVEASDATNQRPPASSSVNSPLFSHTTKPDWTSETGASLWRQFVPQDHSTTQQPGALPVNVRPGRSVSGTSASVDADAEQWLAPYLARASVSHSNASYGGEMSGLPDNYSPWWDKFVRQPGGEQGLRVGVDWLVQSALQHSSAIRAVSTEPHIRQSVLLEESAEFDWRSFLETTYDDFNDPVGNTLTTGNNQDRFLDRTWSGFGGFRRRTQRGGELELSQQLGRQSNNSVFLLPNPQGTSRLELNYTQPLLSGAGRPYNLSRVVLAQIDHNASRDEVIGRLQDHLLKVTEAYWDLYRSRARFFQRRKLLDEAMIISQNLSDREQVDALHRQVLRAKAAVARRRSEIARAQTQIRNGEAQLRLLVNDPALIHMTPGELTPIDAPSLAEAHVSMSDSLATALANRTDISQGIRAMRSTNVRLGVAKNEVLPKLDLLVSSYVAGLEGRSQVFQAWTNQFSEGRPGFSVGLLYEMPLGNRAANARYRRRHWELVRAVNQFRSTIEKSLTEVELAVREVHTTYREMLGKYQAMVAAQNETTYLDDRFRTLPGANDSATLLLEDLLDSQERLADEEAAFVDAQVTYSTSLVQLKRALGTLFTCTSPASLE